MAFTDDDLFDMSDADLEAAFKEAKSQEDVGDTDVESEYDVPTIVDEEVNDVEDNEDDDVEFDEEDKVDDLEQPDEDSDDDASLDDEEEDESEEESEDEDGDLDEEPETDDEKTTKDEDDSEEDEQPVRKHKYRANGQEYEFTENEILERFGQVFGQSMNYTQKMQQIKPWRKTIDAIEEANLSQSDISFAIDVLKGDKDAIATLMKRTGIDALELDTENAEYTPKDYGRNDAELDIKDIVNEISGDKEYATTYNVLEKQWDSKSRQEFVENPEMIRQLHIDVKNGMFDVVSPIAKKLKVYDGGSKSDLDYYKLAAQQYFDTQAQEEARQETQRNAQTKREEEQARRSRVDEVKAEDTKRKATKAASSKRKAAAPTKSKAGSKKVVDYLDDTDDAFDEWYKNLEDSQ